MARMLGRSKSLRLKSSQKDLRQQEADAPTPLPTAGDGEPRSDHHLDSLKAAAHTTNQAMRVESPDQVQRPRTASTPGDRGRHLQFHKKAAPVAITPDDATFGFPLPSPTTVLYAAEVHEDDMIGMALGSPTTQSRWNHPVQSTDYVTRPELNRTYTHIAYDPSFQSSDYEDGVVKNSTTDSDAGHDVTKPKISRWKSLFGRKNTTPQPFYQLDQSSAPPSRVDSHNDGVQHRQRSSSRASTREASKPPAPTSAHEIREARKKHKAAKKAAADEAKEARNIKIDSGKSLTPRYEHMKAEVSPKPPPKDDWRFQVPKVTVSSGSQTTSPRTLGSGPLLDVDIPNVEMERYSVMFGSLLRPDRSSSLLVRRQADPGKLKPLTELSKKKDYIDGNNGLLKPTRRATSPSPAKSPTFSLSLFPPPASKRDHNPPSPRVASLHRPRPLARSNTAPSISPSRQTFADPDAADDAGSRSQKNAPRSSAAPRMHQVAEAEAEQVPQLLTPTPSTRASFDSQETAMVPLVVDPNPWNPRLEEPEWEILSKPAEAASQVQREGQGLGTMQEESQSPPPHHHQQEKPRRQSQSQPKSPPQAQDRHLQKQSQRPTEEHRFSPTSAGSQSRDSPRVQTHHHSPRDSPRSHALNSPKDRPAPKHTQSERDVRGKGPTTVGLARQVSVSRATGPKLLKPMVVLPPVLSEKLVDRKPLTPTLVELKNSGRKSQRVVLEDA
ncbi:uncharacterized protein BDZ99DRAFT_472680 [Mytilinidion resinicola]|uniref:Uncharacterized protein n=1 Tax=Mytilinidion resinicola TaxID=574789 RepID=A0A6A6Z431_9PEZI|nr:uncharacterized protein BDZ99DRAFT_472680 [Mytilinidion resinicola]KAF2815403.1 hypothetical protein BDZ99DRAFT_472680 [Mytilinidion resinicola]